jgi:hypothetical protein
LEEEKELELKKISSLDKHYISVKDSGHVKDLLNLIIDTEGWRVATQD